MSLKLNPFVPAIAIAIAPRRRFLASIPRHTISGTGN
jgi:hypothetical protein